MAVHQAPPSLGFSRQEHWSGLPFPSPQILLRSHHSCMNNFLSEGNDPEFVTMTRAGRSVRKRDADPLLKTVFSFSYPPAKELSAFLHSFSKKKKNKNKNPRLSNQLSELIAPFRYSVSWIMELCLKSKDRFLFWTCKVKKKQKPLCTIDQINWVITCKVTSNGLHRVRYNHCTWD